MPNIVNCLWFDGQAEQAAELYTSVFPDSKVGDISRYPPSMPELEGQVMTVSFTLGSTAFLALNGGPQFSFTEAVSFQIMCADQQEVDHYWNSLTADGGEESQCGWLKDRFGVSWQVIPTQLMELMGDPDPDRAARAAQAMYAMKKLDVAALKAAADSGA